MLRDYAHDGCHPEFRFRAKVILAANVYQQDELRGAKKDHQELRGVNEVRRGTMARQVGRVLEF